MKRIKLCVHEREIEAFFTADVSTGKDYLFISLLIFFFCFIQTFGLQFNLRSTDMKVADLSACRAMKPDVLDYGLVGCVYRGGRTWAGVSSCVSWVTSP